MTPDPRDPLQQRREAMTAWERGLRPKGERHWLLWLALAVLLVFIAWRGAEWLLARQPERAARPAAAPPVVRLPTVPSPADAPDVRARPAPQAESYGVTKCLSATGQAAYSDGPCPAGSRATTVWVQPDLNLADGMSAAEREASMQNNSAVAAEVQQHERRVAQNPGGDVLGECAALGERIRWVDAMARQPQGAQMQDWLANEKKMARDRQFRLRCR